MLLQSPLGALTAFLYDNHKLLKTANEVAQYQRLENWSNEQLISKYGIDMFNRLSAVGSASRNSSVRALMKRMIKLAEEGVKGIAPSATFCESMALTEANYNCEDFKMPYPTVAVEIPEGCRGYVRLDRKAFSKGICEMYEELWGLDMDLLFDRGAECRYVIISEHDADETGGKKEKYFAEFDGSAEKIISVEIVTSEFLKGHMTKRLPRQAYGPEGTLVDMGFNPAPVTFYGRPMIKGKTVEDIFMGRKAFAEDDSPGSIHVEGENEKLKVDLRWTQGSELEYTMRITRMAINVIFALVNMGYTETKKAGAPKLLRRGGKDAQRAVPDVLEPATVINTELEKYRYDTDNIGDGSSKRPHFRRGHWRKQRHGPERKLIKNVWILPTVVNRDKLRAGAEDDVFGSSR